MNESKIKFQARFFLVCAVIAYAISDLSLFFGFQKHLYFWIGLNLFIVWLISVETKKAKRELQKPFVETPLPRSMKAWILFVLGLIYFAFGMKSSTPESIRFLFAGLFEILTATDFLKLRRDRLIKML